MHVARIYDVLVVGAGATGASAACLAAKRGRKTALLEQGPELLPLLRGFERAGAHFDTGFTYAGALGPGETLRKMLEAVGLSGLEFIPVREEGYDRFDFEDSHFSYEFVTGKERLTGQLKRLFPAESAALDRFFEKMLSVKTVSFDGPLRFESLLERDTPYSLQDVLDELFTDPRLKAVLSLSSFLHGTPPSKISFSKHANFLGEMYQSVCRVKGGGLALARAFEACLSARGVDTFTSARVVRVEPEPDGNKRVTLADGRSFLCRDCVCTVQPPQFLNLTPEKVYPRAIRGMIAQIPNTYGVFTVHCKMHGVREERYCNRYYLPSLDIEKCFDLTERPVFLAVNFSDGDPQTVNLMVPYRADNPRVRRDAPDYETRKQRLAQAIMGALKDVNPHLAAHLTVEAVSTPATLARYTLSDGGIYGRMHDMAHSWVLSPVTKIPGLYLAGQSVTGPGLRGAVTSALVINSIINDIHGK